MIDKRDSEKFRRFKTGQFNVVMKETLDKHGLKFIWGFHKSQALSLWKSVRKNDRIFFSVPKNNFEVTGKAAKKIIDKSLGRIEVKKICEFDFGRHKTS